MPCASRVSLGITIRPARSIGTTIVMNGLYTITMISWYRFHHVPSKVNLMSTAPSSSRELSRSRICRWASLDTLGATRWEIETDSFPGGQTRRYTQDLRNKSYILRTICEPSWSPEQSRIHGYG